MVAALQAPVPSEFAWSERSRGGRPAAKKPTPSRNPETVPTVRPTEAALRNHLANEMLMRHPR